MSDREDAAVDTLLSWWAELRNRERWSLGGLAVAGVVLTHWLAYLVAGDTLEAGTSGALHRYAHGLEFPHVDAIGWRFVVVPDPHLERKLRYSGDRFQGNPEIDVTDDSTRRAPPKDGAAPA